MHTYIWSLFNSLIKRSASLQFECVSIKVVNKIRDECYWVLRKKYSQLKHLLNFPISPKGHYWAPFQLAFQNRSWCVECKDSGWKNRARFWQGFARARLLVITHLTQCHLDWMLIQLIKTNVKLIKTDPRSLNKRFCGDIYTKKHSNYVNPAYNT